ncbi:contactin-associated protein 1 [Protopterus annectens]|uniref:contactin-associated protein 1 n=1 Tax=Protopterus annectens TaxID=7888 RepID=UPI001CFBB139|nr:contactin-associated protein 1 [Protopterus annectens]
MGQGKTYSCLWKNKMQYSLLPLCFIILLLENFCQADYCNEPLVAPLYAASFSASSRYSFFYSPNLARLHGGSGWAPDPKDPQPWLQINLKRKYNITAIATQGTYNTYDWVTRYILLYSDREDSWKPFYQQGNNWTFAGNLNTDGVVHHRLYYPIIAQYLRFVPVSWNPQGKIGLRVEAYGCSYTPSVALFDGEDVIAYRLKRKSNSTLHDLITFNFKTFQRDAFLLHGEGSQGDELTFELKKAQLWVHISLGSSTVYSIKGRTSIPIGSLLDDQHWHFVSFERYGRYVNFTLDGETKMFRCNGDFDHLDLDNEVLFGGTVTSQTSQKPTWLRKRNFRGCMENVIFNGINVIDQARRRKPQIWIDGNLDFYCQDVPVFPVMFAGINNFLLIGGTPWKSRVAVSLQFRTWDASGLLLFTNFEGGLGSLEVGLSEGQINVSVAQPGLKSLEFAAGHLLNDGFWHSLDLDVREGTVTIIIDNRENAPFRYTSPFRLQTGDKYFFGGCPRNVNASVCSSKLSAFHGCMQEISVDEKRINLREDKWLRAERYANFSKVFFNMCGITDRCTPNPCEHDGRCIQSWDDFVCNCDFTGYKGEVCHKSLYKESCEAYRLSGKIASDNYTIDPDGSGPLRPFIVRCVMKVSEEKAWTIVHHNREYKTVVTGTSVNNPFLGEVHYWNASWDDVGALANISEYCEQKIQFDCYDSKLFYTPGTSEGAPFTFWMGRNNERHFYWGGSRPGIQRCKCGLEKACADPRYYCNCDAGHKQWRRDEGLLSFTDHLPVNQIVVGDTNRPSSEAQFLLGPLRCNGDARNNTVTFTKGTYIEFPTYNSSTSMDIALYFKTTSPSGVFLENSGLKNFFRVELNSSSEVGFAFDVGDGYENLTVRSPKPLNDDEWHQVKAEINVKLARVKVDKLPWVIRRAPPQSYVHLNLTKPMYVGAAEYRLRPFLGCLRGLRINGIVLNLEGKANESEGVRVNCTGYCNSPRVLCQNGGRCVERYSHYTCDCNGTAFDGPICNRDIGGYFETGTWLRYNILPPAVAAARELANIVELPGLGYNLTNEEIQFSFSTRSAPAVLIYLSTYGSDYMAVVLKHDGTLQLRYQLGYSPYLFTLTTRNMTDGQPHKVNITRIGRNIYTQVDFLPLETHGLLLGTDPKFDPPKSLFLGKVMETGRMDLEVQRYNSPGFTGCLSGVRFNNISPLKAVFVPNDTMPPVNVSGELIQSNCAAMPTSLSVIPPELDPWYLGSEFPHTHDDGLFGIVVGFLVTLILLLAILLIVLYVYYHRYKGSYHTNEPKIVESTSTAKPFSLRKDKNLPQILEEAKNE